MAGVITRFAPSPTGPLHLGHAFCALTAWDLAHSHDGVALLRIEDIDQARCRDTWETRIYEDLDWLGLKWPDPPMRQSTRRLAYGRALQTLQDLGVTYACTCTRGDIRAALSAPQEGVSLSGPDGPVYPGTCRHAGHPQASETIRLDIRRALDLCGPIHFHETGPVHPGVHQGDPAALVAQSGDVVLARRDIGTSYHLAVVVDDAAQLVTHVTRGADLFEMTLLHVILQRLLALPTPEYHHHRLIRDETGKRLAKRDDARALTSFRSEGASASDIRRMLGF